MAISPINTGYSPQIMSGASAPMPPQKKMENLYNQIDSGSAGAISQQQFNAAFQNLNPPYGFKKLGADAIWAQLDPSSSGKVSQNDFVSGMTDLVSQIRNSN